MRRLGLTDQLLGGFGAWLAAAAGPVSSAPYPGAAIAEAPLGTEDRRRSAALMRVNHAGEIAAQGLYLGQALVARDRGVRQHMREAAVAESDHLAWCRQRLEELGSHVSYLSPLWGLGSVGIGMAVGLGGDPRSLGFVAETEHQVGRHLESHLAKLPPEDRRSRAIVKQMRCDEEVHQRQANEAGGQPLPSWMRSGMAVTARVMTRTAYWL